MTTGLRGPRQTSRTVIASRLFAPEPAAASFRLLAAANALAGAGRRVTVLTSRPAGGGTPPPGLDVRPWPVLRDRDGAVRGVVPYASFDAPLFFRLLFTRRLDVVLVEPPPTTGSAARLALALRRVPYVYYAADLVSRAAESGGHPPLLIGIARRLERFALRGAARVVTVNDEVARDVERFGVPAHRVDVVGNGVDTGVFRLEGPVSRPPGVADSAPCFVYAGSMNTLHGAGIFVEAFERVVAVRPDTVLVMVGRGEEVEALRERGRSLPPGSFVLMDSVSGTEAAALLRGARAGLASIRPGSGYEFALATKAVAAAGTGTPVIFAGEGTTADLLRDGDLGECVPWRADDVAQAMIAVLDAPDDARPRRARWVRHHASLDTVGARVARVVADVARGSGDRRAQERDST